MAMISGRTAIAAAAIHRFANGCAAFSEWTIYGERFDAEQGYPYLARSTDRAAATVSSVPNKLVTVERW